MSSSETSDQRAGTWVQAPNDEWHRSTAFDGYTHETPCGQDLNAREEVETVEMDTSIVPETGRVCPDCHDHWKTGGGNDDR